ncbi:hypothetical protein M422DRAFT_25762 [Sphaerobolus stellatus SS14]|nr:hypothetical protein M422DRAFT_25762 [Sphaerobolus stellatus SS14]
MSRRFEICVGWKGLWLMVFDYVMRHIDTCFASFTAETGKRIYQCTTVQSQRTASPSSNLTSTLMQPPSPIHDDPIASHRRSSDSMLNRPYTSSLTPYTYAPPHRRSAPGLYLYFTLLCCLLSAITVWIGCG